MLIAPITCTVNPADSSFSYSGVMWLSVPANNQVPAPNFRSAYAGIDQATLLQAYAGQVIEVTYTTQSFAAGTPAATVQAAEIAILGQKQAALNASPLAGIIGTVWNGSAWVAASPTFNPSTSIASDPGLSGASGLVSGLKSVQAFGYAPTSATVAKQVNATPYTPQGTGAQRSFVSTSSGDSAAGNGAQEITWVYLDSNFVEHTVVLATNGKTPVNTGVSDIAYTQRFFVSKCGAAGGNQGTISIFTATAGGGSVWGSIASNFTTTLAGTVTTTASSPNLTFSAAQTLLAGTLIQSSGQAGVAYEISANTNASTTAVLTANYTGTAGSGQTATTAVGDGTTNWCQRYVPAGVTAYLTQIIGGSSAVLEDVYLLATGNPATANLAPQSVGPIVQLGAAQNSLIVPLKSPVPVVGPNLIQGWVRPLAATASTCQLTFECSIF